MNIIGLLIGIIYGFGLSLDMFFSKKTKSYSFYIRNVITIAIMLFLRVITYFSLKLDQVQLTDALISTFLALAISIGIGFLVSYLFYRRLKKRYRESIFSNEVITFFDLLINGYSELKQSIKEGKRNEDTKLLDDKKSLFIVMENIGEPMSKFLIKIYKVAFQPVDPLAYVVSVLQNFVNKFLAESEARFILRKIDREKNEMVTYRTTSDSMPSPIPLNKTNMIIESMKHNKPLIYSRNTDFHYNTGKSLEKRKYTDYVTYCLVQKNNTPIFSIALDVKSEEAQKKMFAVVDCHILEIICEPIKMKLEQITMEENL